jgi:pimeloyl-ACP methyl ester carboxylesterase
MDLATFERDRLALFARHDFDGVSRWVSDRLGRRTYLIERGDGHRPTILIHGGLSQASEWSLLAGRLPGRVIIPDRPGCGLSYRIDYGRVADFRQAAVDWVLDLVDGIDVDRVDLVGNSLGGFFALAFALAHPERVHRLVAVGAAAGTHPEVPLFARLWGRPVIGPLIGRPISDPETFRRRVLARLLVAHPERVPRDFITIAIAAATIPGSDRAAHTMLRTVTTLRGFNPKLLLGDDLPGLQVPTLFLWGDADAFAPPSRGQEVAARMPDARFVVLPDTGHLPQVDEPAMVAAAIAGFLASISAPGNSSERRAVVSGTAGQSAAPMSSMRTAQ